MTPVVAIALTSSEQTLLIRAVRELAEREDAPQAADVLEMLERALDAGYVAGLAPVDRQPDRVEGLA
jgi:hypothetical protein